MPELKWVRTTEAEGVEVHPQRHHWGDAGFDLVAARDYLVQPGEFEDIDCGIRVELPALYWGLLTGRSSTLKRRGLLVVQGVIDSGYRGPMFYGVQNLNGEAHQVKRGERLAQLIPIPLVAPTIKVVQARGLSEGDRGEDSFGSTGA